MSSKYGTDSMPCLGQIKKTILPHPLLLRAHFFKLLVDTLEVREMLFLDFGSHKFKYISPKLEEPRRTHVVYML